MSVPASSNQGASDPSAKETVQVYMPTVLADELRKDNEGRRRRGYRSSVSEVAVRIIARHYAKRLRARGVVLYAN